MPVTLKLSDEEARDLAEMLSTAATVAASNQQDGAEARLAAWGIGFPADERAFRHLQIERAHCLCG
ncbi:hypothetical protein M5E88_14980 [Akkermansia muciniphila]|nr:hypothetical protein M5E88_14980 [Akkermansia muciniphila]